MLLVVGSAQSPSVDISVLSWMVSMPMQDFYSGDFNNVEVYAPGIVEVSLSFFSPSFKSKLRNCVLLLVWKVGVFLLISHKLVCGVMHFKT